MKLTYSAGAAFVALMALVLMPLQAGAQDSHPRPHEVNQRLHNQNARIRQGIHSGQLTRSEARNVRLRDARVRAQMQRDRINHNGHLTARETKHLNGELNRDSRAIYNKKHNDRVR